MSFHATCLTLLSEKKELGLMIDPAEEELTRYFANLLIWEGTQPAPYPED